MNPVSITQSPVHQLLTQTDDVCISIENQEKIEKQPQIDYRKNKIFQIKYEGNSQTTNYYNPEAEGQLLRKQNYIQKLEKEKAFLFSILKQNFPLFSYQYKAERNYQQHKACLFRRSPTKKVKRNIVISEQKGENQGDKLSNHQGDKYKQAKKSQKKPRAQSLSYLKSDYVLFSFKSQGKTKNQASQSFLSKSRTKQLKNVTEEKSQNDARMKREWQNFYNRVYQSIHVKPSKNDHN